jgi:hypothetical protein
MSYFFRMCRPCVGGRIIFFAIVITLLSSCGVTRGGPKSFLTVKSVVQSKDTSNDAMIALSEASTESSRNLHLSRAMADVDILYVQFRDELLRSDNAFNASVDLASLLSDLAGKLTNSAGVKDNYLTLGALLTGSRATVNNRFLYAQTGLTMVKGMDAARAAMALEIKKKQSTQDINEYSGRDAYADVLKYYFDGTLPGGLIWLQAKAAEKETQDRTELATLRVPTPEELVKRESLKDEVVKRISNRVSLERALGAWSISFTSTDTLEMLQGKFADEYRRRLTSGTTSEELKRQLTNAKYFED